jgi:hypothetical protein
MLARIFVTNLIEEFNNDIGQKSETFLGLSTFGIKVMYAPLIL